MDASGDWQQRSYVLGSDPDELTRLDGQAAQIDRPTRLLLQAAGLAPGMRVLDLGTGLGHVARICGEIVGPAGEVVGIDNSAGVIEVARRRAREAGVTNVTFVEGEAGTWRVPEPVDAIVARLLLFHVADPVAVVRHHLNNLRAGGSFVAIDFDVQAARAEPSVPIVEEALRWVLEAFRAAGAWPQIGARLGPILEDAGLGRVTTFGIQAYASSRSPAGLAALAAVVRSLAPAILRHGIATAEQLDLPNLQHRLADACRGADAVVLLPTVAGAWGSVAGGQ